MKWWLSRGDKPEGPFPAEHVAEWLRTGQIPADTLACPEGGQEWKPLSDIKPFSGLAPPAPPPPPRDGPQAPPPPAPAATGSAVTGPPGSSPRAKFGLLKAAIVLTACSLGLEFINIGDPGQEFTLPAFLGLCVGIPAIITWAIFHYHLWSLLPAPYAETTPGKAVGFLFIPFYDCYWVFRSLVGVNRGLNRLADAHGLPGPRANLGLAVANSVFFVVAWLFVLLIGFLPSFEGLDDPGAFYSSYDRQVAYEAVADAHVAYNVAMFLLCSAPGAVLWLLMVLNQKRMVEHLLASGAPVNPASALIDR